MEKDIKMVKKSISRMGLGVDYKVEYDANRYKIEDRDDKIDIIDLQDDKAIRSFERTGVRNIWQCYKDGKSHFITKGFERHHGGYFRHYIDTAGELRIENSFDAPLGVDKIGDTQFAIFNYSSGGFIYNLENRSQDLKRIYFEPNVIGRFRRRKMVLVDERVTALSNPDVYEDIRYGMDLNTFEVATPIFIISSEKLIQLYGKRDVREKCKLYKDSYLPLDIKEYSLGEATKYFEVQMKLDEIARQQKKPKSVWILEPATVDKEHLKQFTRTPNRKNNNKKTEE